MRERSSDTPGCVAVPEWLPPPGNQRYHHGISRLESVVDELLAERESTADGEDLLSLLRAATGPDGPSENEIRSQLARVLFAGHETSATALTWPLYEICRRPEIALATFVHRCRVDTISARSAPTSARPSGRRPRLTRVSVRGRQPRPPSLGAVDDG
ncbi:cytochrome P450 [Halorubrum xinjiangense]|uniref:cytochrome P450 n=1 Tax=Halorubrum xinjiangense TaxID=261291 RepID=UPI00122DB3CC